MSSSPNEDPNSDIDILSMVQQRWQRQVSASAIYNFLLTPITIVSARKGHVTGLLTLTETHINSKGGLHGSVSATIVDAFGGLAISSWDGREKSGPSVDINVSYLGMAGVGDQIRIEASAERVGGSLAFTSIRIVKIKGGDVHGEGETIVLGRHTKYVRGTGPAKS